MFAWWGSEIILRSCPGINQAIASYQLSCLTCFLQVDLNLAQENAEKPDDYDERKKLWLDVGMSIGLTPK